MSYASINQPPSLPLTGGTITGNIAQTGATTLSTGTGAISLNGDTTIASAKTLAVTTADKLTLGGVIVPVLKTITYCPLVTDVSKAIYIATETVQVSAVRVVFGIASISGTITVEKLTGTTAPASGTALLTGALSVAGTANTVASGVLTSTTSDLQMAVGDRLGIVLAGTLTSLIGALIEIDLKRI